MSTRTKWLITSLMGVIFFAIFTIPAPAAELSSGLTEALQNSNPTVQLPVYLILPDQADADQLKMATEGLNKTDRRNYIVNHLKTFAASHQQEVLQELNPLQGNQHVTHVKPLWLVNVIRCYATPIAINTLAASSRISEIHYDPERPVLLGGPNYFPEPDADPKREARSKDSRLPSGSRDGDDNEIRDVAWGVSHINATQVWNELGIRGDGVLVAVLDTGTDYTHTDLVGRMWTNSGEIEGNGTDDDGNGYEDDIYGYDFAYDDGDPMDGDGHGTHCSGTVAGDGTGGTETGVAPEAQIMAIKVLTDTGSGSESGVWSGMEYAVDNGADIISMSLGWMHAWDPSRDVWRQACDNTQAAGTVMIIAAGNERDNGDPAPDNIRTPGDVPDVVTVGATDSSDEYGYFSSFGPVSWENVAPYNDFPYPPGLIKPDVAAPGVGINSTTMGGGYSGNSWSGTSMATPHVAGATALLVSINQSLQPADIKMILENSSIDLGPTGKDNDYGSGRIDAYAAVSFALNGLGFVEGTVTDENGGPLEATISILNSTVEITADETGYYKLGLAADENYDIEASYFGYVSETQSVFIEPDETQTLDFSLQPADPGVIEGYVSNSDTGDPIPNAEVRILSTPLDPVFTDASGFYEISPPGDATYTIAVTAAGHLDGEATQFIPANQTTQIDFELQAYPRIVIWDRDGSGDNDADAIAQAITANGEDVFIIENLLSVGDLSYFNAIFVCVGIYPNNYSFSANSEEEDALITYLENGGRLFMEGGDVWAYDTNPATLRDYFNIEGVSDGASSGDASSLVGEIGTFAEGMSFDYNGENNYIDHLDANGSAFPVLRNESPSFYGAIAYIDDTYNYRTLGMSFEFGGLSNGSDPNNQTALMTGILEFFEIIDAPPAAPTALTIAEGSGQLLLNWNPPAASDLDGHSIFRSTNPNSFPSNPYVTIGTSGFYLDENVQNGTTYYYYVTAFDTEDLESEPSNVASGTPTQFPPPTNLAAEGGFDGYVPLSWQAPVLTYQTRIDEKTGQPFYESHQPPSLLASLVDFSVFRSESPGGPYTEIAANVSETSYQDNTVTNDVSYYYVVAANYTDPVGQSAYSNEDEATPSETPPVQYLVVDFDPNGGSCPEIDADLQSLNVDGSYTTSLTSYDDVSDFDVVFVCLGIYPANHRIATGSETETKLVDYLDQGGRLYIEGGDFWYWDYEISDMAENLVPYFHIDGLADGPNGGDTGPVGGIDGTFLDGFTFDYDGDNSYMDRLSAMSDADEVFENLASGDYYINGVAYEEPDVGYKTLGTSFELGGLADGADDRQDLIATIMDFFLEQVVPPTYPNPPVDVVAIGGNAEVDLSWTSPTTNTDGSQLTDLAGFHIYRSLSSGNYSSNPVASVGVTESYVDNSVSNGQTYYYQITAFDADGDEGPPSEEVSAETQSMVPPASLTATSGNDGHIDLVWTRPPTGTRIAESRSLIKSKQSEREQSLPTALEYYRLYRSQTSGGPYQMIGNEIQYRLFDDDEITNGMWYYYVVTAVYSLDDGSEFESAYSPEAAAMGNTPPSINLLDPNGGEYFSQGLIHVSWDTTDPDMQYEDAMTYLLQYSTNGGQSWLDMQVDPDDMGPGGYEWDVHDMPDGNEYKVKITVTDSWDVSDSDASSGVFTIDNDWGPNFIDFPPIIFAEDESMSLAMADIVQDVDTPISDLTWNFVGADQVQIEVMDENLVFSAAANWYGQETITLQVSDPTETMAELTRTVTVTSVNDAPILAELPAVTFEEDHTASLHLADFTTDVDHDTDELTWTAVVLPPTTRLNADGSSASRDGESLIVTLDGSVATFTPEANWAGSREVEFTVTDPDDASHSRSMTTIVVPVNDPPELTIIEPDGVEDVVDYSIFISWNDVDVDDNATIQFFVDDDDSGFDGSVISPVLTEDDDNMDFWEWMVGGMPEGYYYVYGVISDGEADVYTYAPGPVTVLHRQPGDVDGSGQVSDADIVLLVKMVMGYLTPDSFDLMVCDLNQNGQIDAEDVIMVIDLMGN